MAILAWLHTQAAAMVNILSAVAANRPEPARNVIIYMLALLAIGFIVPKIVQLVSK
jgi:hypothetical protein